MTNTNFIVSERFRSLLSTLNLSVSDLAKQLGYERYDKLYNIYNGKYLPSFEILHDITKKFVDVNTNWLLTGEGPILHSQKGTSNTTEFKPPIELIPSTDENTVTIPIVEISVAAGIAGYCNPSYLEIVDGIKLPISMLHRNAQYYCIRVKGDSMAPTILDSSYVVVRLLDRSEWRDIRDQHVYVVSDREGRAYLKRLKNRFHEHGFITCMSDNPDKVNYSNFNLMEDEINTILYAEFYISAKMPNIHETYYKQVGELQDDMDVLKEQVKQLMKVVKTIN